MSDKIWRVYGYRSPEDKWYIGQTTLPLTKRAGGKNGYLYTNKDTYFSMAIKKFGFENMEQNVLRLCTTQEDADYWEQFFIQEKNSLYPNGYNMQSGGIEGSHYCQELRDKISKSVKDSPNFYVPNLKGYVRTDDFKKKVSEGIKEYYKENGHPCNGRVWSNDGTRNYFDYGIKEGCVPGQLKRKAQQC